MAVFKARARTIDMLGRQQIAGRPTAISELYKNAHDAYAAEAIVDFYRSDLLFVLRDDGVGMTKEEFEQKWLVLGTESKASSLDGTRPQVKPPKGVKPRRMLGEKGIGRLAIASIGAQVLVLTRSRVQEPGELVASFIPWSLFTLPGLDLHEISVPLRVFGAEVPNGEQVQEMIAEVRESLRALGDRVSPSEHRAILAELKRFDVDPRALMRELTGPTLAGTGHGTHFYIKPADENLVADIDRRDRNFLDEGRKDADAVSKLKRFLVGFTNTMAPGRVSSGFAPKFNDHKTDDDSQELIAGGFFEPDHFKMADHRLSGRFDEFGAFSGNLRVYKKESGFKLDSPMKRGIRTLCGPFGLEFAVVQGDIKDSLLYEQDHEEYYRLSRQLEDFGGLYIYRDGIRVLPYGNPEVDFLGIEERRTKGASYYFFSYRRMFGVIDLTSEENGRLHEKAGREGFIEDDAYRQLRELLVRLLVQLAAEKFRADAETAQDFLLQRAAINEREALRRRREEDSKKQRAEFEARLEDVARRISRGEPKDAVRDIVTELKTRIAETIARGSREDVGSVLAEIESSAVERVDRVRDQLILEKPKGIGLSHKTTREFEGHGDRLELLEKSLFSVARATVEGLVDDATTKLKAADARRRRADAAVGKVNERVRARVARARSTLLDLHRQTSAKLERVAADVHATAERVIDDATANLVRVAADASTAEFHAARLAATEAVSRAGMEAQRTLQRGVDTLEVLKAALWSELKETPGDVTEALEEEVLELKERERLDLELAQLGMAIEVINHEFAASIRGVRSALRRLKQWVDRNSAIAPVYEELRSTFDHLDGYLSLFTPLQRRLYRAKANITGANILKYLEDVFGERMARHKIALHASKHFLAVQIPGYPSTFYPAFVNLIDNSIYWLKDAQGERVINLDRDGESLLLSDTGPGIPKRDQAALFKRGFTRKPSGRGLGLYISRAVLRRDGFDIEYQDLGSGKGARFVMRRRSDPSLAD